MQWPSLQVWTKLTQRLCKLGCISEIAKLVYNYETTWFMKKYKPSRLEF
jgi:hypothetical protein